MTEKVYYVYQGEEFKGYVVATSDAEALSRAAAKLNLDPALLSVKDTQKTKPKCCPRR